MFVSIVVPVLLGFCVWTFLEYAMHNWLGHKPKGKYRFSKEHLAHHADVHYFSPASEKARMAAVVMVLLTPVSALIAGPLSGIIFSVSVVLFYLWYEIVHRRTHTHPPRGPYSRWTRRNHFYHHFSSPFKDHGVTTPIWDIVFRTHVRPGQIRVPRRHAMDWLCDENGEVKSEYQEDYVLVGRMPKAKHSRPRLASQVPRADLEAAYAGLAPGE